MAHDDWSDDEPWGDNETDSELDDEDPCGCPECGGPVHPIADCCPACGYWLSEADRRAMGADAPKPAWLRVTASVVLIAFLASLLALGAALF